MRICYLFQGMYWKIYFPFVRVKRLASVVNGVLIYFNCILYFPYIVLFIIHMKSLSSVT